MIILVSRATVCRPLATANYKEMLLEGFRIMVCIYSRVDNMLWSGTWRWAI